MTPIKKLIEAVGIHLSYNGACEDSIGDESMCENLDCTYCNLQRFLTEYESEFKPIAFPVEIDVEFKDGDWFTVDSDGSGEKHIDEPEDSPLFCGCWTSEGGRFFAIFKTPDDCKKARWQLVDGKWVQK